MAGKVVARGVVRRKKDKIYFIDSAGNVRETNAARGRKKKAKRK